MKYDYLKYIFKKDKILPIHLSFLITYKCNAKCKSCFAWSYNEKEKDLSLDEIKKLAANFKHLIWLQLGGGEPFLRDDICEICKMFNADTISVPTNATLTDKIYDDLRKILPSVNRFHLSISIDGIGNDHDELRGLKGSFKKLLKTYQKVYRLKKEHENFLLGINTVISSHNYEKIEQISEYVKNNMDVNFHNFEFLRGNPREKKMTLPPKDKIEDLINTIKFVAKSYDFYKNLGFGSNIAFNAKLKIQDYVKEILLNGKRVIPCYAGKLNAFIDPYGNVYPCELYKDKFGSMRRNDFNFEKIWLSKKAEEFRKIFLKKCYCTHSCFMLTNILFNPLEYPGLFIRG